MKNTATRVKTAEVRLMYCHLDEPQAFDESQKAKYSVSMIIKKDDKDTLGQIKKNYEEAVQKGIEKYGQGFSKNVTPMVRPQGSNNGLLIDSDQDDRYMDDADFKGTYILSAKAINKPMCVAKETGRKSLEGDELKEIIYSGCYGKVLFNFYPFNAGINKGVACGLDSVMKTRDGESLGGRVNAMDYFGDELDQATEGALVADDDPFGDF